MKTLVFSSKNYDKEFLRGLNKDHNHELKFIKPNLSNETVELARDFPAVCLFVNDDANTEVVKKLGEYGTKLIALRCAGFNNVDINEAYKQGIKVVRVPAYSPYAVAEHTIALLLNLNRKIHRSYARVREGNFLLEGLMGFDINDKTVGIIGTGKIGTVVAKILQGFGTKLLAYDKYPNDECKSYGVEYVELSELYKRSDIITLHCPLTPETHHLIGEDSLKEMKDGVAIINTSRGALIDSVAIIDCLKHGKVGYLGLDVYEEESDLFFEDLSGKVIQDDVFARLLTFPNVVITGHQAFFTREALENIAETTLDNISAFEENGECKNEVTPNLVK